jgi:hypothetical protein
MSVLPEDGKEMSSFSIYQDNPRIDKTIWGNELVSKRKRCIATTTLRSIFFLLKGSQKNNDDIRKLHCMYFEHFAWFDGLYVCSISMLFNPCIHDTVTELNVVDPIQKHGLFHS